jgi:hypothetical protein
MSIFGLLLKRERSASIARSSDPDREDVREGQEKAQDAGPEHEEREAIEC